MYITCLDNSLSFCPFSCLPCLQNVCLLLSYHLSFSSLVYLFTFYISHTREILCDTEPPVLNSFSVTIWDSIHYPINDFTPFYDWIIFQCVYATHFQYPFICWRASKLFSELRCCELWSYKPKDACMYRCSVMSPIFWNYRQKRYMHWSQGHLIS